MDNRLRPRYHFTPPANWMNDPNGLIHWKGTYHLFYQHNPHAPCWGSMHWGHASSTDLVNWTHQPVALAPDPDGPDRDGCFSGVAVPTGDRVTFIYTGVRGDDQLPCLALCEDDDLRTWTKHPGNPVIAAPPDDLKTTIFRDHSVWRDDGWWYQVIGSGIENVGGAALLYRSADLEHWEHLGPLLVEDRARIAPEWVTMGWECPDFFTLDDRHVLTFSLWNGDPIAVGYYSGRFADHRFVPDRHGLVDGGQSFYAPQSFNDESGRRVMFGWLREECSGDLQMKHGWSGAMSLPRVLGVDERGDLTQRPAPEVENLRGRHLHLDLQPCDWFRHVELQGVDATTLEIDSVWEWGAQGMVAFNLCASGSEAERTVVALSVEDGDLVLDTRESSVDPGSAGGMHRMKLDLEAEAPIRLRVFVDRSVVEVFLNDRYCLTGRVYPTDTDGGQLHISSTIPGRVEIWELGADA
jgi:beta-fructofuranosidase